MVALWCTSKRKNKFLKDSYNYYPLDHWKFSLSKKTYVDMQYCTLLDEEQFMETLGFLSETDMKEIYKRMDYQKYMENNNYFGVEPVLYPVTIGDIIYYQGRVYIVIDEFEDKLRLLKYNLSTGGCIYNKSTSILKKESYQRLNSLSAFALRFVLENYKKYLEEAEKVSITSLDNEGKLQKGDLFSYKGKLYYGYSEMKSMLAAFEVYSEERSFTIPIMIANQLYYSFFIIRKTFNRNAKDCEVLFKATASEIEMIDVYLDAYRNTSYEIGQGR